MGPFARLKNIENIEIALDGGMAESLYELFRGTELSRGDYEKCGKESLIELFEIQLRTQIAADKLMFYKIGILKTKSKGDLRTAKIVSDNREQLFAVIRLKMARSHPEVVDAVQRFAREMDAGFFLRLGAALKRPALDVEHISASKLQTFLLHCWASERKEKHGRIAPPLCYFSDPAIAKLATIMLKFTPEFSPAIVRKTWERLGLKKSKFIQYWTVREEDGHLIISELRHAEEYTCPGHLRSE